MEGTACVAKTRVVLHKAPTQACAAEGSFRSDKKQPKMRKLIRLLFILLQSLAQLQFPPVRGAGNEVLVSRRKQNHSATLPFWGGSPRGLFLGFTPRAGAFCRSHWLTSAWQSPRAIPALCLLPQVRCRCYQWAVGATIVKAGAVCFALVRGSVGVFTTENQHGFYFSNKSCSSDGI